MRLATYRSTGIEAAGVVFDDHVVDVGAALGRDPLSMRRLIELGPLTLADLRVVLIERPAGVPGARLIAPLPDPGKVVAIGLNYFDHADETSMTQPKEPLVLAKFPSSIIGPGETMTFDRGLTDGVDVEAELGVVIARRARDVLAQDALDYVLATPASTTCRPVTSSSATASGCAPRASTRSVPSGRGS